jgi:hypothetical protein
MIDMCEQYAPPPVPRSSGEPPHRATNLRNAVLSQAIGARCCQLMINQTLPPHRHARETVQAEARTFGVAVAHERVDATSRYGLGSKTGGIASAAPGSPRAAAPSQRH